MTNGDRFLYGWIAALMSLVALGAVVSAGSANVPIVLYAVVLAGSLAVGGFSGLRYWGEC